jgi:hypothetical protein
MGVPRVVLMVVSAVFPVVWSAEVDAPVGREIVPDMPVIVQVPDCCAATVHVPTWVSKVRTCPDELTII